MFSVPGTDEAGPKYKDGFEWGGTFEMNPGKTLLTDAEYQEMIDKIKANL